MVFPVERTEWRGESGEGWGMVGRLEEGGEYEFSVVAVIMVRGVSMQGNRTQPVKITTENTDGEERREGCVREGEREEKIGGEKQGVREDMCERRGGSRPGQNIIIF